MNDVNAELRDLTRQLRAELAWAARTGIEVTALAPSATSVATDSEAEVTNPGEPAEAPDRGRRPATPAPSPAASAAPVEPHEQPHRPADRSDSRSATAPRPQGGRNAGPWDNAGPPNDRAQRGHSVAPENRDNAPTRSTRPTGHGEPQDKLRTPALPPPGDALWRGERANLGVIRDVLGDCTRCRLSEGRNKIVFGVGDPNADLMFIGEGPGADEDRLGEPFVGKAGQLLTKIIGAMGIDRREVYIANIVKCRPPNNRDPELDEVDACRAFLEAQIDAVRPKVIVTLGRPAAQALLRTNAPIGRLRGKWTEFQRIPLMPTFHPAYLLRNPDEKRAVWQDMKQVISRLGRQMPQKGGR